MSKPNNCFVCQRIKLIKKGKNPEYVAELKTGYVILPGSEKYPGYTLFSCKKHVSELHFLSPNIRNKYLQEMAEVAQCVWCAFKPNKLNYELLGNTNEHLHWHIIPRYANDPNKKGPIWYEKKKVRQALISSKERNIQKEKLLSQLLKSVKNIKDTYKVIKKRAND